MSEYECGSTGQYNTPPPTGDGKNRQAPAASTLAARFGDRILTAHFACRKEAPSFNSTDGFEEAEDYQEAPPETGDQGEANDWGAGLDPPDGGDQPEDSPDDDPDPPEPKSPAWHFWKRRQEAKAASSTADNWEVPELARETDILGVVGREDGKVRTPQVRGLIRYPGGKAKLRWPLCQRLCEVAVLTGASEYREPFFGGGGMGLNFLSCRCPTPTAWVNDFDDGVACLWTAVAKYPEELKSRISGFRPRDDFALPRPRFEELKEEIIFAFPAEDRQAVVDLGFKKLVIHQCSYSGLGTKSGGPLGGAEQKTKYLVDSRWSPAYLCSQVDQLHEVLRRVRVTNLDFEELVKAPGSCLLYLDPPYYDQGNDLYQYGFTEADHVRLRDALRDTEHPWILSYDKHDKIRELYQGFADLEEIRVKYSITAPKEGDERKASSKLEYLITPRWLSWRLKARVISEEALCQ